jgi:organic hydroperoxide reductase OsmC/OhrA
MTIEYSSLEGTGASVGRAGNHVVVADRPAGKAFGTGLGLNGAELLALSIGGCFCNDLHYTAEELGLLVTRLKVEVTIELGGEPTVVESALVSAECEVDDEARTDELLRLAQRRCTIANSLRKGIEVAFSTP